MKVRIPREEKRYGIERTSLSPEERLQLEMAEWKMNGTTEFRKYAGKGWQAVFYTPDVVREIREKEEVTRTTFFGATRRLSSS